MKIDLISTILKILHLDFKHLLPNVIFDVDFQVPVSVLHKSSLLLRSQVTRKKGFSSDPLVYPTLFTNLLNQRLAISTPQLLENRVANQDLNQDCTPDQNPYSSPQTITISQTTYTHSLKHIIFIPTHTLNTPTTPKSSSPYLSTSTGSQKLVVVKREKIVKV